MAVLASQDVLLNINFNADDFDWNTLELIYQQLDGWLGYGQGGELGEEGIPYWFSFDPTTKHINASVEFPGLQVSGLMAETDWQDWYANLKAVASRELGYQVGAVSLDELD